LEHQKLEEISVRIAQVSPLYESVPPKFYGGTERIVSYLTEELVSVGHDVTLFASGDSETSADIAPICERALRLDSSCVDPISLHFYLMEQVLKRQHDFDVIHSHIDCFGFVTAMRTGVPVVSTLHGRLDLWEYKKTFSEYDTIPVVSISNAQRRPVPNMNWVATVYHGLPGNLYDFNDSPEDYLVYMGRISPEKKVESAIRIALISGMPLKIAAKVDRIDTEYFEAKIKPLLNNSQVEFLGELNDSEKNKLIGSARAFIHAVDWPEPFGVTLIEAMACGTPVIARRRGSIPEVIDHGITGFTFEQDEEAGLFIRNSLDSFSRLKCRRQFEKRFLAERMAQDYLNVYEQLISGRGNLHVA
jgi:glycosyltransferase involved in cell wall biosynthesis